MTTQKKSQPIEFGINFDDIRKEVAVPVCVLRDGDREARIEAPDWEGVQRFEQGRATGDVELMLRGLCGGGPFDEVAKMLGKGTNALRAMSELTERLSQHFMGQSAGVTLTGPGGGVIVETDPRKVQALLNMGFTRKGE